MKGERRGGVKDVLRFREGAFGDLGIGECYFYLLIEIEKIMGRLSLGVY